MIFGTGKNYKGPGLGARLNPVSLIEPEISFKEFRENWAQLIQKIYNVNPLVCSKCFGSMKIISFIEDEDVISKILKHLGLWQVK
jgi:hypothetical protein